MLIFLKINVYYNNDECIHYIIRAHCYSVGERGIMLNPFRELFDNIKAEWDLATANPSPELCASVKKAINNTDADLCAEFEDSTTWLGHGRILGDMEAAGLTVDDPVEEIANKIGWPAEQVRETVEAEKIVLYLRKKLYGEDQIRRIGKIAMALQKNEGNVSQTANQLRTDVESVETVVALMDEYQGKAQPPVNTRKTSSKKQPATKKAEVEKPFVVEATAQ